jgi:hypothetical protein
VYLQEAIQAILDSPRRASVDSAGCTSPSTLFPRASPIGSTPLRQAPHSLSFSSPLAGTPPLLGRSTSKENAENLNPADTLSGSYYASLQRATAEIQNSFKSLTIGAGGAGGGAGGGASSAPATSKDSGISQLSAGDDGRGLDSPDRLGTQLSDNGEGPFGHRKNSEFENVDSGPHSITGKKVHSLYFFFSFLPSFFFPLFLFPFFSFFFSFQVCHLFALQTAPRSRNIGQVS